MIGIILKQLNETKKNDRLLFLGRTLDDGFFTDQHKKGSGVLVKNSCMVSLIVSTTSERTGSIRYYCYYEKQHLCLNLATCMSGSL
jgi:hypothetical protein